MNSKIGKIENFSIFDKNEDAFNAYRKFSGSKMTNALQNRILKELSDDESLIGKWVYGEIYNTCFFGIVCRDRYLER
jgi:hypothetical protein